MIKLFLLLSGCKEDLEVPVNLDVLIKWVHFTSMARKEPTQYLKIPGDGTISVIYCVQINLLELVFHITTITKK
jgi:hypothetical protein